MRDGVRRLMAGLVLGCVAGAAAAVPLSAPQLLAAEGANDAPAVAEKPDDVKTRAVADNGQAHVLAYKFRTNDVVSYEVVHLMEITTTKDVTSETAANESRADKHYRVVSVDRDGNAILELMIDRVRMSAKFGNAEPVKFDSDKPNETPPQFKHVEKSVGKPLARIKVSPSGQLISTVELLPELQEAQGESEASRNFLVVFPERPLRVGDSWKDEPNLQVRVTVGNTLTRNVEVMRRYELVSVDGNLATIRVRNSILTPVREAAMRAQLIQRSPEGVIVFDMEKGLLVSRTQTINKTEIGVFGDNSSMRAVSDRTEVLVPGKAVARKPGAAADSSTR